MHTHTCNIHIHVPHVCTLCAHTHKHECNTTPYYTEHTLDYTTHNIHTYIHTETTLHNIHKDTQPPPPSM